MRGERIAAPVFALLLLFSAVGAGVAPAPIGTAAAADTECDTLDALWYDMVNIGDFKLAGGGCNEDVKTVQAQENLQQKIELNQMGKGAKEGREPLKIQMRNQLEESGSVVSMEARAEIVRMLNNGTTNATKIRQNVSKVIANYYARRDATVVETYNAHVAQFYYIVNASKTDGEISNTFVYLTDRNPQNERGHELRDDNRWRNPVTKQVTLVNGSTHNYSAPRVHWEAYGTYSGDSGDWEWIDAGLRWNRPSGFDANDPEQFSGDLRFSVSSVDGGNVSSGVAINISDYRALRNEIAAQEDRMQSNYDELYIQSIVNEYEAGQLNTSEMVTPEMMVQEFGAEPDESGYLAYQVAMTSFMGVSSPNGLNASMTIEAEEASLISGSTFSNGNRSVSNYAAEGLIFAESAPNGSFTVGETYNSANLDGPVWFINSTSARKVSVNGNFTITRATNADGDELSTVSLNQKNRETYSADEFVNETREQQTVRLQIEREYQPAGGTGGGGGGGGGGNPLAGLAAALGVSTGIAGVIVVGVVAAAIKLYTPN